MCIRDSLYPALHSPDHLPLGEWQRFDEVEVDDLTVEGFEVQMQGLSQRGGFDTLITGARLALGSRTGNPRS